MSRGNGTTGHYNRLAKQNMSRVNQVQMKKLLDLLSEDGVLVDGKIAYINTDKQNFWKRVARQLNSVENGVYKNTWKWCKMWADWKNKTKKKANILLRRKPYKLDQPCPSLSALEKRLLKLINYPLHDKEDVLKLEMVAKKEAPDVIEDIHIEYLNTDYNEYNNEEKSSEHEDKTSNSFDGNGTKFCNVDVILQEDQFEGQEDSFDTEQKVKLKGIKRKETPFEEFKVRMTLQIEKERIQQKNEELRLRALELKLRGDELRLKEMEMNKINYLSNIEEEKLKCFKDISSSLKELLEHTRSGNLRFHNAM